MNLIIHYFLRKNIAIAKQRAWDQTVASRGKGQSFWQPYVEEWDHPPVVTNPGWDIWLSGSAARFVIRKSELTLDLVPHSSLIHSSGPVLLYPIQIYPFVGIFVSAYLKALGTGTYLHKSVRHRIPYLIRWARFANSNRLQYFEAKGMTKPQIATFVEERKWHYRGPSSRSARVILSPRD